MPAEKFKLPASSYEELTKIIKAYGQFSEPASLEDISKLVGISPTGVSGNNAFLVAVGLLTSGNKKAPTENCIQLASALEHEMPEEIRQGWQAVVNENDFLSKVIASIRIRSGMEDDNLLSHIAYSAGQPRKKKIMTGARTVVDILRAAEFIRDEDGTVSVQESSPKSRRVSMETEDNSETSNAIEADEPSLSITQNPTPGFSINLRINVDCKPEDLDALGEKLRRLLDDLKGTNSIDEPQDEI